MRQSPRFAAGLPEILTGQLAPGDSTTAKETSTWREGAQGTERAKAIQICSSCWGPPGCRKQANPSSCVDRSPLTCGSCKYNSLHVGLVFSWRFFAVEVVSLATLDSKEYPEQSTIYCFVILQSHDQAFFWLFLQFDCRSYMATLRKSLGCAYLYMSMHRA